MDVSDHPPRNNRERRIFSALQVLAVLAGFVAGFVLLEYLFAGPQ